MTKDSNPICLLTNGLPIQDENGDLQGYQGVDKVITAFKPGIKQFGRSKGKVQLY